MMSQQGRRQQSVRDLTMTAGTYNDDWMALFDRDGIPAGPFDGRFLSWLNVKLGTNYTNLPEAMQRFAESKGAANWSSLGTFTV